MAGEYKTEDLSHFDLIVDLSSLDGTSYFEFHPKELPHEHTSWNEGSLFIRDAGFDFFSKCFELANPAFDYFAFERFNQTHIDKLLEELSAYSLELQTSSSREVLFSRYAGLFNKDIWNDVDTNDLKTRVLDASKGIQKFVQQETAISRCLCVLGM